MGDVDDSEFGAAFESFDMHTVDSGKVEGVYHISL